MPLGVPGHTQPGWRHGVRGHSQMAAPRHSQTGRDCAGSRTPGGWAMLGPKQRSTQLKPPVHYAFLNTHTRARTHTHRQTDIHTMGFPGGSDGKESACNAGDLGSVLGLGRSPGEENGNPPQYSCLDNTMDRGAWWATVRGVTKSGTWLRD